jgi:hypothetical protein
MCLAAFYQDSLIHALIMYQTGGTPASGDDSHNHALLRPPTLQPLSMLLPLAFFAIPAARTLALDQPPHTTPTCPCRRKSLTCCNMPASLPPPLPPPLQTQPLPGVGR